ncbi:MAG: porin PorA family protein [Corynebacterium sp.]|nr:porin PorA family protein [Corynebacterium sp.]
MKKSRARKLTPVTAFSLAAVLWIGSSLGQSVTYSQMKPLPLDLERTITTEPAATVLYNSQRECPDNAPFSCHITATESYLERTLHTSASEDNDEALLEVEESLRTTGKETLFGDTKPNGKVDPTDIFNISDSVVLIRHSTYPVLEPISSLELQADPMNLTIDTGDFTRDGLQYFFPFNTERRSYQYFDVFAQDAWPLDFVREENDHFIFEQKIPVTSLRSGVIRAFTHPKDISDGPDAPVDASHLTEQQQQLLAKMQVRGTVASFYPAEFPEYISTENYDASSLTLEETQEDAAEPADSLNAVASASSFTASSMAAESATSPAAQHVTGVTASTAEANSTTNTAAGVPDATNPSQNPSLTPIELPESLAALHPQATQEITLDPYYTVTRTIEVEPKSGVIVDQTEDIFFFYAFDSTEAAALAASSENQRTILRTSLSWDKQTQQAALDQAVPTTRILQIVRVIGYLLNMVALGFLVTGFVLVTRSPRSTITQRQRTEHIGLKSEE